MAGIRVDGATTSNLSARPSKALLKYPYIFLPKMGRNENCTAFFIIWPTEIPT
jgi:hypothetical protein